MSNSSTKESKEKNKENLSKVYNKYKISSENLLEKQFPHTTHDLQNTSGQIQKRFDSQQITTTTFTQQEKLIEMIILQIVNDQPSQAAKQIDKIDNLVIRNGLSQFILYFQSKLNQQYSQISIKSDNENEIIFIYKILQATMQNKIEDAMRLLQIHNFQNNILRTIVKLVNQRMIINTIFKCSIEKQIKVSNITDEGKKLIQMALQRNQDFSQLCNISRKIKKQVNKIFDGTYNTEQSALSLYKKILQVFNNLNEKWRERQAEYRKLKGDFDLYNLIEKKVQKQLISFFGRQSELDQLENEQMLRSLSQISPSTKYVPLIRGLAKVIKQLKKQISLLLENKILNQKLSNQQINRLQQQINHQRQIIQDQKQEIHRYQNDHTHMKQNFRFSLQNLDDENEETLNINPQNKQTNLGELEDSNHIRKVESFIEIQHKELINESNHSKQKEKIYEVKLNDQSISVSFKNSCKRILRESSLYRIHQKNNERLFESQSQFLKFYQQNINNLQNQKNHMIMQRNALAQKLNLIESEKVGLISELNKIQKQIEGFKLTLSNQDEFIKTILGEKEMLVKQILNLQTKIENMSLKQKDEKQIYEQNIKMLETDYNEKLKSLKQQNSQKLIQIQNIQMQYNRTYQQYVEALQKINEFVIQNSRIQEKHDTVILQNAQYRQENKRLVTEIVKAQDFVQAAKKLISQQFSKNQQLHKNYQQLQNDYHIYKQNVQQNDHFIQSRHINPNDHQFNLNQVQKLQKIFQIYNQKLTLLFESKQEGYNKANFTRNPEVDDVLAVVNRQNKLERAIN